MWGPGPRIRDGSVSGLFAGDREHAIALINNGAAEMEMGLAEKTGEAKRRGWKPVYVVVFQKEVRRAKMKNEVHALWAPCSSKVFAL